MRLLRFDITSICFEGECTEREKIDCGYSHDHRPDAEQVNPDVNVTSETGIPLSYRVLASRTADRPTPMENMKGFRSLFDLLEFVECERGFLLVSDRARLDRR